MTTFWWVRHGPTHEKAFVGWRDVPADLSDTAQIARVSAHLPPEAVVISSDLRRAVTTADAIGGPRKRLAHAPELREFNFGVWDGMKFGDVAESHPRLSREFWEKPGDVAPPQGESWHQVAIRVGDFVDHLERAHGGRDIVVVAHIGVILTQVARALGVTPYQALAHQIDNFSVTRLQVDADRWQAGPINHLP